MNRLAFGHACRKMKNGKPNVSLFVVPNPKRQQQPSQFDVVLLSSFFEKNSGRSESESVP
jgi:hypothetical protein